MYPNGKLVSSEIEIRGGKSYEQKTYRDDKGAESVIERLVTKSSYDASIARLEQQLATLNSLRDDALE